MHLARGVTVEAGLAAYDDARRPLTAAITLANRGLGPDLILEEVHRRAPDGFTRLHDVISETELRETATRYKQLAGFDPALLNQRESFAA